VHQEHQRSNWDVRRWYRTARWARLRRQVLVEACYTCADCRHTQLALEVHHMRKHDGNREAFFARGNLLALCAACHTKRTARGE
jgi:5-methylcytosine-specific restriction protein A